MAAYGEFLKSQGEAAVYWKRASSPEEVLKEADVVWIKFFSSFSAPFTFSNFTWSVAGLEHFRFFQAATTTPECVLNSNRAHDGYTFCSEIKLNNIQLELTFVLSGLVLQISLHPILDKTTYHLINKERLALMKPVTSFLCPNLFLLVWIEVQKTTIFFFWALLYFNNTNRDMPSQYVSI